LKSIIKEIEVNSFLAEVENTFPNFVAGIVCDHHGFPIAARIPKNFHIKENQMALAAIAGERCFIKDSKLMKVKRDLDKTKNIKLFLLLEKTNKYTNRFKILKDIIESQGLF